MAPPTNRKQFKPPRPGGRPTKASKASVSKSSKTKSHAKSPPRRKSAPSARTHVISSDDDDDDDGENDDEDSASSPGNAGRRRRQLLLDEEADDHDNNDNDESMGSPEPSPSPLYDPPPTIPPALLTKLLHHHFPSNQPQSGTGDTDRGSNVRISKDAMGVVGKYMETFVREAIARAAYERNEELDRREKEGKGREVGGDVLEVSTLSTEPGHDLMNSVGD
ncbi:MAG: hypothetical protein OHK93_006939 [Ramalina farinacea]|uniref:Uncharacterized protein n=1 Tax=Ramalina farinacea TaxID=258253 RepID=A0AA43TTK1_9LECA|nr:hypothetical protein [Ramalina farinacea]